MPDLENVGVQFVAGVREKPILLRLFGVANEKESHRSIADERDGAGKIGIVKRDCPSRVGGEKPDANSVEGEIVARMYAVPRDSFRLRRSE